MTITKNEVLLLLKIYIYSKTKLIIIYFLNLAYLMRGTDTIFAKKLIETAFEKNSYLKNPLIYKEGDECNIFKQQSNFIFSIKDLGKLVK